MKIDKATKFQQNQVPVHNARASFCSGQVSKPISNTGSISNNVEKRNQTSRR